MSLALRTQPTDLTSAGIVVVGRDAAVAAIVEQATGVTPRRVEDTTGAVVVGSHDDRVIVVDLDDTANEVAIDSLRSAPMAPAILVVASTGRVAAAHRALAEGANLFLIKPLDRVQLAAAIRVLGHQRELDTRNRELVRRADRDDEVDELVGCSPATRRLMGIISRAGENDATVLVEGRPGSGKSLVARLIHARGRRADNPFESWQADEITEGELVPLLQRLEGGTLLLEDVDKLRPQVQARLVRYLKDDGADRRRGVRLIATTSARLAELTARGAFREDLYYRLNVFPVGVPSLQERREDVALLAAHFVAASSRATGLPDRGFTPAATILLESNPWPGNVTQLRNSVLRAHTLAAGEPIDRVHVLGPASGGAAGPARSQGDAGDSDEPLTEDDVVPFQEEEKRILGRALRATRGNVRRAAQLLGIGRATLYRKIQVYQLRLQ